MDENIKLCDAIQSLVHVRLGVVQRRLSRMANSPHRTAIQFRKMPKENCLPNKDDTFILELGYRDTYTAIVDRIAKKLHVDRKRIMLARHCCYTNKPEIVSRTFLGCLFDLLESNMECNEICNVLYYKVLPLKTNEVAKQVPKNKLVRLCSTVYYFTSADREEGSIQPLTEVTYRSDETIAEVKVGLLSDLAIDKKEISKWRFALLERGGSQVYLDDSDVLYDCLAGKDDHFPILEGPSVTFNDIMKDRWARTSGF